MRVLGGGYTVRNMHVYLSAVCDSGTMSLEAGNRIEKRASTIDSGEGCEVHTSFAAWVQQWRSKPGSSSWE